MFKSISAIAALLFAAAILYAGNGLQSTLLSVRGDLEGFPTAIIGLLASAYYAGFILGRAYPGLCGTRLDRVVQCAGAYPVRRCHAMGRFALHYRLQLCGADHGAGKLDQ